MNIKKRLSGNTAGEDYYKLLKFLPYNESFSNVNIIIHHFIKSKAKDGAKKYIAKIFKNISH